MPTYRSYNVTSPGTGNIPSSEETNAPIHRSILRFIACCVLWSVVVTVCLLSRRHSDPESAAKLGVYSEKYKSGTIIPMSTALREITKHTRSDTSSHEEMRDSLKNTTPLTTITASNENSTMPTAISTTINNKTVYPLNDTTPASNSVTSTEHVDRSALTTMPTAISTTINNKTVYPLNNTTPASTSVTSTEHVDVSAVSTMLTLTTNRSNADPNVHMNYSVKACDDFYEYACGAYEAKNSILGNHLEDEATRRIFDQAKTLSNSGKSIPFFLYYQSCLDYEKNITERDRIKLAEDAIQNIGTVYNESDWHISKRNLTKMLSALLLRNSAPLFDIVPDINVDSPGACDNSETAASFFLMLEPPAFQNSLFVHTTDTCYVAQKPAMREKNVNFEDLYNNYTTCKVTGFIASVRTAIEKFPMFGGHVEEISTTLGEIVNNFYMVNQDAQNIGENHVKREYKDEYNEEEFYTSTNQLNWQQLLRALANRTDESKGPKLRAYSSYNYTRFDFFNDTNDRVLNNVLLGLYAHKIYYELVVPGRDENYCKRIAIKLMERHASSLYMSSFNATELIDMKATVTNIFKNLMKTLESSVRQASWIKKDADDTEIMKKIRDLTIEIPDVSYYQGDHKLNPELSEIETQLTGNFFHDTMMLQINYRKSMYAVLDKSPNEYEQTWTHFALPYQTFGSTIHGLNKIIMPYGAVDWQAIQNAEEKSSTHLVLATLGTQIAHEIAHHFDTTGIYYSFNKKTSYDLINCDVSNIYNDYKGENINHYIGKEFYPPSNEQSIRYKILPLSLDGILSENVGLQLAYDTMLRLNSTVTELLPRWPIGEEPNKDKQFFLAYAQMQCMKKSHSPPFVSVYEDAHLPSRLQIFLAASNNEIFRNTWQCSNSSNFGSGNIMRIFPNLKTRQGSSAQ